LLSHALANAFVIRDGAGGRYGCVRPALKQNQFAAAAREGTQVSVGRIQSRPDFVAQDLRIPVEIEAVDLPVVICSHHVPHDTPDEGRLGRHTGLRSEYPTFPAEAGYA